MSDPGLSPSEPVTPQDPTQANPDPMGVLNTPQATPTPTLLDSSQIDRNLQYMATVQQSWNLPTIPPNVQLDLASQSGMDTSSLGGFLQGVAQDVNAALNPFAAQAASAAPTTDPNVITSVDLPQQNTTEAGPGDASVMLTSLEGGAAPTKYDTDAVDFYKTKATAYGFLPPGSDDVPGSWDPSLNFTALDQVQTRDLQNRIAGEKPGSASYKQIFGALNDFVDPSSQAGALTNAVAHTFMFSGKDAKSFAHGWGNFFSHPSAGNLWTATKSSVPVVLPILTDVMLVTGAGEVLGAMRAGELAATIADTAATAADAASAAADAAGTGAGFVGEATAASRAADTAEAASQATSTAFGSEGTAAQRVEQFKTAANQAKNGMGILDRLNPLSETTQLSGAATAAKASEPGFIAGKLAASDNTVLHGAGSALQSWRDLKTVQVAKTVAGVATRAGVVAVAGTKIAPTSSDFYKGYRSNQKSINTSGLGTVLNVAAIPLAPPSIFRPGAFTNLAAPIVDGGRAFLSSNDGARATWEVAKGLGLSTSDQLVDHFGGIADGGGDAAQNFVMFINHQAALYKQGTLQANSAAVSEAADVTKWNDTFHNVVNAHVSQIIKINHDDVDTFASILRQKAGDGTADAALAMLQHPDPLVSGPARDAMNVVIDAHNANRAVASHELLKSLAPGDVTAFLRDHVNNIDDWKAFTQAHSDLQGWTVGDGLLNKPAAFATDLKTGAPVYKDVRYEPALQPGRTAGIMPGDIGESLSQDVLQRAMDDPDAFKGTILSPVSRRLAVGDGRTGMALDGTPMKNEAKQVIGTVKNAQSNLSNMQYLAKNTTAHGKIKAAFDALGQPIHQASPDDLTAALNTAGVTNPKTQAAAQYLRRLSANGEFDPADMVKEGKNTVFQQTAAVKNALETNLEALNNNAALWGRFGNVNTSAALNDKIDWLSKKVPFLAGEVSGVPDELASTISNSGYKLVHGQSYLHPQDLQDLVEPFASVSKMQAHRLSLGTYILPGQNLQVGSLIHAKTISELVDTMHAKGMLDETQANHILDGTGDSKADAVLKGLYDFIGKRQDVAQADVDLEHASKGNYFGKFTSNVKSAKVPQGLRDLTTNQIQTAMDQANLPEWSDPKMASLVKRAVLKGHDVGFQYRGLSTVEDKLRAFNPLVDNLLLGGTSSGSWLRNTAKVGGKLVAAGGIGAGVAAGETALGGDLHPNDIIKAAEKGALTGAGTYGLARTFGKPIAKGLTSLTDGNFLKYTFLPDELAHLRNTMRFTVSPYFDLRRYTKGAVISQMVADHNDVQLPINLGLKNLAKDFGSDAPLAARNMYEQATGGASKLIDDDERFFSQRGVLGFSPNDQKAATFYRLQQQGKSTDDNLKIIQKIFSYGQGRTPLEQSINFAFFPFSFEKKIVASAATFLTDDFARTLMMHDALKTYDTLNQHYDLSKELQDHVPLLPDLEKLNAFEHGLNPGQLGGINAPLLQIAPLLNQVPLLRLFLPVGVRKAGSASALLTKLLPAYNDIKRLSTDLEDQGHVVFGATHQTRNADKDAGYSTIQNFMLTKVDPAVKAAGFKSYNQAAAASPALKQMVDNFKGQTLQKYPEYAKALASGSAKTTARAVDLTRDLAKPGGKVVNGVLKPNDYDLLRQFKDQIDQTNAALKTGGFTAQGTTPSDLLDNAASVPVDIQRAVRQYAIYLAENSDDLAGGQGDGGFAALYAKYYQAAWGPISRPA